MKRMKLTEQNYLSFKDAYALYYADCKRRNLRQATINHYVQSSHKLFEFFDEEMDITTFGKEHFDSYVCFLKSTLTKDVSINAYLRDLITVIHFLQNEGIVSEFKMKSIKVDSTKVETYTDADLSKILKKPNTKTCSFAEYECWVMSNFLFLTGVRQHSLMNIRINEVDFDSNTITVSVTKNRKVLLIPMCASLAKILHDWLKFRQAKSNDDFLFCNVYGGQFVKSTHYHLMYEYNKKRGVETTGIHRYRHTFAKQWILNGGNVAVLSRLMGHSSLAITQNYINLLTSDLNKAVEEMDLLSKFQAKQSIKLR